MTIHRIKLKDLNAQFLKKLKEGHSDQDIEVAFWLQPKLANSSAQELLTEEQFWELINLLDWEKLGANEAVIEPLVQQLSTLPVEAIQVFEDRLSEKLYLLDGENYAKNIGLSAYQKDQNFSVDTFLYARCCVVSNGKKYYQTVLKAPRKMPKDLTFGALLRVASTAYFRKTGTRFQYQSRYIYETFANASGWPNHNNLIENIIN